jgi:FMN reductase (NADPH)
MRIMKDNPVIQTMLAHKSIRKYSRKMPHRELIEKVLKASQQAPFASQYYSVLLSRNMKRNPWHAPLLFTICVDSYKFELIMAKKNWKLVCDDMVLLFFGIQDATLMAENMVIAGRSLGLGSCFLGSAIFRADKIAEEYRLPMRVLPIVQLAMGYPAEDPPPRPRYPLEFTLFEDKYPEMDDEKILDAMRVMDEGYLAQDYYKKLKAKIKLEGDRKETYNYDNYSWTEHICRKWGQWYSDPNVLIEQLEKRGFHIHRS